MVRPTVDLRMYGRLIAENADVLDGSCAPVR
jgi:hypothetical protein